MSITAVLVSGWVLFGITLLVCAVTVLKRKKIKNKYVYNFMHCIAFYELLYLNRATSPVNKLNFGVHEHELK